MLTIPQDRVALKEVRILERQTRWPLTLWSSQSLDKSKMAELAMVLMFVLTFTFSGVWSNPLLADEIPNFSRDIMPLLSDNCLACHGPDDKLREADLRLDIREGAIAAAIVPGKPHESELLRRILSTDPSEVMPPPSPIRKNLPPRRSNC